MKETAIAFDFDGTLVRSGFDKGVHIMYAAYAACAATGFRGFLHPEDPGLDVERLLRALLAYPGAPRFQQLAALLNSLLHDRPLSVEVPAELGIEPGLAAEFPQVRQIYNTVYSGLNEAAASVYWTAFPDALEALPRLAVDSDLYIASGVPQDIVEADLARHGYDRRLFQAVWGANRQGGDDKAELLGRIRARGYRDVLFVGDTIRDLEYAQLAGVKFFRITASEDFTRLTALARTGFPDQTVPWSWTARDRDFFRSRTRRLVEALLAGRPYSPAEACDVIHA
jgi:phosphoglycolate phosphatase-like HAD superfamily hydrolase